MKRQIKKLKMQTNKKIPGTKFPAQLETLQRAFKMLKTNRNFLRDLSRQK